MRIAMDDKTFSEYQEARQHLENFVRKHKLPTKAILVMIEEDSISQEWDVESD